MTNTKHSCFTLSAYDNNSIVIELVHHVGNKGLIVFSLRRVTPLALYVHGKRKLRLGGG